MSRVETTQRTLYSFDELDESAQQTAIDKQRESNGELQDPEFVFDDAVIIAKLMGIEIATHSVPLMNGNTRQDPTIYYSGFCQQGDGACFVGSYEYRKGSVKAVKSYAPQDSELHRIVEALFDVQNGAFFQLTASMSHSGHYYHSGCMSVTVNRESFDYRESTVDQDDSITELMRDFANWIYGRLRDEYEYQTSEESAKEAIECNGYEFDSDGNLA